MNANLNTLGRGSLYAGLMAGALAMPAGAQTITAVMHSGLRVLDPVITTAHITRDNASMIFDTLVSLNSDFEVVPQMAEYEVSEDGLTYTFTLRDGLTWHDGGEVTPADCIASMKRWMERDGGGQMIADKMESLEATGDNSFELVLTEPFPYTLTAMAKVSGLALFMMPERIASTPSDQAIEELIGSGPFKFVQEEFQPGVRVVFEKFEDYVVTPEPADWFSGAKEVLVDRVEWVTMPDAQTAINALVNGEIDYMESVPVDLLPLLETVEGVETQVLNDLGSVTIGRMNFLHPPFDDPQIRRAAMMALNQEDVLTALIGNPEYYQVCGAIFGCGTPYEFTDGSETLTTGDGVEQATQLLEESDYDGTPIVLMQPTDVVTLTAQPIVAAQALRNVGFNVDMQPMDWQTLVTRRASQAAPSDGGWNIFFTNWVVPEVSNPLANVMLNGRGDEAWFGWPTDEEMNQMLADFGAAEDEETRKSLAEQMQAHVMENVNYVHLGQYFSPAAWRSDVLSGVETAPFPVFWGVSKDEG
ncbi:peptide/nickel transport system substrate-binding protein [Palleronia aestuarii]|uniref:Peptide/nickel transport system substrate-binding protein n=1 Tax=Palleronia aestuarii TaxID=568105 RepID=A0A2W7P0V5_9RHOB|nr:ABC transporter substrate-binding protein [Palleronia aestuarii]PZX17092.1 peptide/nickel transport system substrate-binding protein [Palleronia aestuarii]